MNNFKLFVISLLLILVIGCKKEELKTPIIFWNNPADVSIGTILNATQLNAIADVPGTFVYTPPLGTQLIEGKNQILNVDFTPNDTKVYESVSKTVFINVISGSGGSTTAIFNPNQTYGTTTDIDGNSYKTITIGTQTWMAENLRTVHYRNGDSVPQIINNTTWMNLTTGGYCNYNNSTNKDTIATLGHLYNWYTVSDLRNIAPIGWHVPTDAEWTVLIDYLGGENVAGGKMKEIGTTHWITPNSSATNESGFTGLPFGGRSSSGGIFNSLNTNGSYWSTTIYSTNYAWYCKLNYNESKASKSYYYKQTGCAIRCIKDVDISTPTLNTNTVTNITQTTAICGGNVTNAGTTSVTARGICWSTTQLPTIASPHTSDGTGTGNFTSNITGLITNTTYYVRAYATNSNGTSYGTQLSFITLSNVNLPIVTTTAISSITSSTASSGGNVTSNGNTITERGLCYSTTTNPTIIDNKITATGTTGSFTINLINLQASTIYYVKAYAICSQGISYGEQIDFTTLPSASTLPSAIIVDVSPSVTTANVIGAFIGDGITAQGVCWSKTQNPTLSSSHSNIALNTPSFNYEITGLTQNTTYYIRTYATNSVGTNYSAQWTIVTKIPIKIGDTYGGGTVFYVETNGIHGLTLKSGNDGIMTWDAAISYCNNLTYSGYSDWRLPSKDELNLFYLGLGNIFTNGFRWSSTASSTSTKAWAQVFTTGAQSENLKTNSLLVSPIRSF